MTTYAVEVRWDGAAVAGLARMSALRTTTEVVALHEISTSLATHVPGRRDEATVVLERPLSDDLAFHLWATGPGLRKEVEVRLLDADADHVITFRLHRAWVCEYAVAPDPTTGAVTESLTLAIDGWERVTPPAAELAEALARSAGTRVERVALGPILSGHLEETERSLDEVLRRAEKSGAVLLFDEADALFAHRDAVGQGNGRYASAELGMLLDRLGRHSGPILVVPADETPEPTADTGSGSTDGPRDDGGTG